MEAHPRQPIHLEPSAAEVHTSRGADSGIPEHPGMGPMTTWASSPCHASARNYCGRSKPDEDPLPSPRRCGFLKPWPLLPQSNAELFGDGFRHRFTAPDLTLRCVASPALARPRPWPLIKQSPHNTPRQGRPPT